MDVSRSDFLITGTVACDTRGGQACSRIVSTCGFWGRRKSTRRRFLQTETSTTIKGFLKHSYSPIMIFLCACFLPFKYFIFCRKHFSLGFPVPVFEKDLFKRHFQCSVALQTNHPRFYPDFTQNDSQIWVKSGYGRPALPRVVSRQFGTWQNNQKYQSGVCVISSGFLSGSNLGFSIRDEPLATSRKNINQSLAGFQIWVDSGYQSGSEKLSIWIDYLLLNDKRYSFLIVTILFLFIDFPSQLDRATLALLLQSNHHPGFP